MTNPYDEQLINKSSTRPPCLDCMREHKNPPKPRAKNQSYCTSHVYKRTQRSSAKKSIYSEVIKSENYEALRDINRQFKLKYSPELVMVVAEEYRQLALTHLQFLLLAETDAERLAAHQHVWEALCIRKALRLRRSLTDAEEMELHAEVSKMASVEVERQESEIIVLPAGPLISDRRGIGEWGPPSSESAM